MMRHGVTVSCGVLLLVMLASGGAAQQPAGARGPNILPDDQVAMDSPLIRIVEDLALSNQLARYGVDRSDPHALLEAARIRLRATGRRSEVNAAAGGFSVDELLRRAEQLAGGNTAILELIRDVRGTVTKAAPLELAELITQRRSLGPNSGDRSPLRFAGKEPAVVYVVPDGAGQLDLLIYDELNNLICDRRGAVTAECKWRPSWTGDFLIDVRNPSGQDVAYALSTNNLSTR